MAKRPLFQSRASKAIDKISEMKFKKDPKAGFFGKMKQRKQELQFNLNKMKSIKELGKGNFAKGAEAVGNAITSIVAADTAKALNDRSSNSYRTPGLASWTDNFSGNPDKSSGASGTTQTSSTTELGG